MTPDPKLLTRPVVFLDIDGVLNSDKFFEAQTDTYLVEMSRTRLDTLHMWFDPEAVHRLNRLTTRANAVIVVSSSWVFGHNKRELCEVLAAARVKAPVFDITNRYISDRCQRITRWLDRWGVHTPWVVLDDDLSVCKFAERAVLTSMREGLQDHHVDAALAVLRGAVHAAD